MSNLTLRQGVTGLCFVWGTVALCCHLWRRHDLEKEKCERSR